MPTRNELAKIHIAIKELGLDDPTYRAILRDRFHQESAADLTNRQAEELLDLFRRKGWRPISFGQHGLIHVLWKRLAATGAVAHPEEEALAAFVEHVTGKDELRRLTVAEASRVIERLKKWLRRVEARGKMH
jgi:phage gp16-like protein